ncbi:fumarate hydratase [Mariluticola halotolerans]|uniref:fumarate hydratase n=1 Tax=Mariluticola halotolerans TaxID=2909283 RepID=UPI0026E22A17|nr:fumarate hydratase [Mariluticola halotolerans]UJQ94719.1 fumarate hydratase [Mariluticola halotolerans]
MPITYDVIRQAACDLYGWSLKKVPDDTLDALAAARLTETNPTSQRTLDFMQAAARAAESEDRHACSDAGFPTYFVKIGTKLTLDGDIRRAFVDGFAELVDTIQPPILKFITHPLTMERSYKGKDMPIVSFDVIDGADYMEITCSPKALGSGRWADLKIFSYPKIAEIEAYFMECVLAAGSQHCPPVIIGMGIGGSFDHAAKMAKQATLRKIGSKHADPMIAEMEERLLVAVNKTGFGPMGTGGDTTALAVHVDYAHGHGFVPVAVCFNCWINRRTAVRIDNDGKVTRLE